MQEQKTGNSGNAPRNQSRRKAIKKLTVGAGVLAGYTMLPEKWTTPIIGQMALPAHAATSGAAQAAAPSSSKEEYNNVEVHALQITPGNNKPWTWLPRTGSAYGGKIKFVFDGCAEMVVPDARLTHGADGNPGNTNQMYYFCGTDFRPGQKEYNNGLASVFGPPDCRTKYVKLYFNSK